MKPSIAITLIICGSFVAGMPYVGIALHAYGGFRISEDFANCYLMLAAVMILTAIIGSFVHRRESPKAVGCEPLPVRSAA